MEANRQKIYDDHKQHALNTASDTMTVYGAELAAARVYADTVVSHALMTLAQLARQVDMKRDIRQTNAYVRTQLENRMAAWARKLLLGYRDRIAKTKTKPTPTARLLPGPTIVLDSEDAPMREPATWNPDEYGKEGDL